MLADSKGHLVRRTPAILFSLALVAGLAACAPADSDAEVDGETAAEECVPTEAGTASDAITVEGDAGALPTITFDAPLEPSETERTVLVEGEGDAIEEGDTLTIHYTIVNGGTGEEIETTGFGDQPPVTVLVDTDSQLLAGLSKTIGCVAEGSRVVGVIPPADAFGEEGQPQFGLEAEQSLVVVADIIGIAPEPLERAEGEPQDAPEGLPAVELAENGEPTITIPDEVPTDGYQLATLIQGEGEEVADGATVVVHYTGWNLSTGEIFDSSWQRGEPASFPTGGVIPGFRDALVGQQVGSQVIAVIPPELGYGPSGGTPDGSIGAEDTIVFVVDILAAQ